MKHSPIRTPRRQRGVVLFIALIVLVAMSLAGIALVRGVDTANLIAGNLAFKQGSSLGGDWGLEQARTWMLAQSSSNLQTDQFGGNTFYWANWQTSVDFTGSDPAMTDFDWSTASTATNDGNGNQVQYVIHRLCSIAGDPASVACVKNSSGGNTQSTKGGVAYGTGGLSGSTQVYYRITVKSVGPRNTASYVQAVMN